jgi:hypothetical protein
MQNRNNECGKRIKKETLCIRIECKGLCFVWNNFLNKLGFVARRVVLLMLQPLV